MSKQSTDSNEPVTNAMSKSTSVGTVTETGCSETPFSKAPSSTLLPIATKKSLEPSPETIEAVAHFKKWGSWQVDISNWEAALVALADDSRPFYIALSVRYDAHEVLPVAAIVKEIKRKRLVSDRRSALTHRDSDEEREERKCRCSLRSLDTFYTATDVAIDKERLEYIAANPSLRLETFLGHLDHASIVKLPDSCSNLGLAIGSAADAAAVSALRPPRLRRHMLEVSVTASVAVEDLQVLPDARCYHLYFPFLSDDRVGSVRPAIEALLPNLKVWMFEIPKCQLTSHGLKDLIEQLRGVVKITYRVNIEESGTWHPGTKEKNNLAIELNRALGCPQVMWGDGRKLFPWDLKYEP